jgi:hypothetical protein
VKRGDAFEFRRLYALTLYALTPAENHNVRNTPEGRKLILRELYGVCLALFSRAIATNSRARRVNSVQSDS